MSSQYIERMLVIFNRCISSGLVIYRRKNSFQEAHKHYCICNSQSVFFRMIIFLEGNGLVQHLGHILRFFKVWESDFRSNNMRLRNIGITRKKLLDRLISMRFYQKMRRLYMRPYCKMLWNCTPCQYEKLPFYELCPAVIVSHSNSSSIVDGLRDSHHSLTHS